MPETSPRNYQSMDMLHEGENVSWTKFYVFEAGKTNRAHLSLVKNLKAIGQTEVKISADCDYVLVICPVVSRVGTNISEALESIPADKPAILVVMHHTFNENQVVAESRRQVNNPNVCLTVDCLFHEQHLLKCDLNDIAWFDIKKFLQGSTVQVSWPWNRITSWMDSNSIWTLAGIVTGLVLALVTTLIFMFKKKIGTS